MDATYFTMVHNNFSWLFRCDWVAEAEEKRKKVIHYNVLSELSFHLWLLK